jgi:steroid delta-isomerase
VETAPDPQLAATVQSYLRAICAKNEQAWLATFAADVVSHDPVGAPPAEGRESLREVWAVLTGPFKTLSMVERRSFYCGSGAAIHWAAHGLGINDRAVDFDGITVFEFTDDGRIQTAMSYWDPAAMMIDLAGEGNGR